MPEAGTVLGFDFGMKRIGVAVGNSVTGTATPLTVLAAQDGTPDWGQVQALIGEWLPDALVVGIPFNMDGTDSEATLRARRFANRLAGRFARDVSLVDERLTSFEARGELMRAGNRRGKPAVDALAACLIVEDFFNRMSTGTATGADDDHA